MRTLALLTLCLFPVFASGGERITFVPTFGNSGPAGFHLNDAILAEGYAERRRWMDRKYEQGSRRFLVHLPYGRNQSKYHLTDVIDARQAPNFRVRAAAASFLPQMIFFLHEHQDATLYVYLGSPKLDRLLLLSGRYDPGEQARLWTDSISDVLELSLHFPGRVGLALDHAHTIEADSRLAALMVATDRQTGLPLMVEGGVHCEPWQSDEGFARLMIWETFKDNLAEPLPRSQWLGEQILQPNGAARFSDEERGWARAREKEKFTVIGH